MIIKNGLVFQEDGTFVPKDIYIHKGKIVSSESETEDKSVYDAQGMKVLPGLVDIHSHGAFGHDFCDADSEEIPWHHLLLSHIHDPGKRKTSGNLLFCKGYGNFL